MQNNRSVSPHSCSNNIHTCTNPVYTLLYWFFLSLSSPALQREQLTPFNNLTCGVAAGVLASLITQPADVVKTRMQINPSLYPTMLSTLAYTLRERGLQGLFTGSMPRAARRTFMAAFTWLFYEEVSTKGDRISYQCWTTCAGCCYTLVYNIDQKEFLPTYLHLSSKLGSIEIQPLLPLPVKQVGLDQKEVGTRLLFFLSNQLRIEWVGFP